MKTENHAEEQARAQLSSIVDMVRALNCDYDRLEELHEEAADARLVRWNMPGYMPDMTPFYVTDAEAGRAAIASELRAVADQFDMDAEGAYPVQEQADMRAVAEELRAVADALEASDAEEYGAYHAGLFYGMTQAGRPADDTDAEELQALEDEAGGCSDADEARQRIEEGALSVDVRSDWGAVGDTLEADEYRILLCTGGPAVQIIGDLDRGAPCSVRLMYQDWGTPWTELVGISDEEREALMIYANAFYFGE